MIKQLPMLYMEKSNMHDMLVIKYSKNGIHNTLIIKAAGSDQFIINHKLKYTKINVLKAVENYIIDSTFLGAIYAPVQIKTELESRKWVMGIGMPTLSKFIKKLLLHDKLIINYSKYDVYNSLMLKTIGLDQITITCGIKVIKKPLDLKYTKANALKTVKMLTNGSGYISARYIPAKGA